MIDLSGLPTPPLKFVLQTSYEPEGLTERLPDGTVATYTPWYNELALRLTGVEATAVLYLVPRDG